MTSWDASRGQGQLGKDLFETTIPNLVTSAIHDRMPVILDPDSFDLWLDPGMQNLAGGVLPAEAPRCPADALLSSEQSDQ